jgi:hypothetical protein
MNENKKEIFLTELTDEKYLHSMDFNEDDMDIDIKSSTSSEDTPRANMEIEEILNKQESHGKSSILIPCAESMNGIENKT